MHYRNTDTNDRLDTDEVLEENRDDKYSYDHSSDDHYHQMPYMYNYPMMQHPMMQQHPMMYPQFMYNPEMMYGNPMMSPYPMPYNMYRDEDMDENVNEYAEEMVEENFEEEDFDNLEDTVRRPNYYYGYPKRPPFRPRPYYYNFRPFWFYGPWWY